MNTTKSYYVVCNRSTGRYINRHPWWCPYGEEDEPSAAMSVGTDINTARERLASYVDAIDTIIERHGEYRSISQDMLVRHLKESEPILVVVTETLVVTMSPVE